MALYTRGGESGVVGFEEHHADDVVADVSLALELLRIVLFIRQQGAYVEHYFYVAPIGVYRI